MIVAIIGSHGVGKTSTINKIKERCPKWLYISESTRELIPELGFHNPYEFVDKYGIAFYEAIIMSQWSCLKLLQNNKQNHIILDRSPIDNLAYYYLHRTNDERIYENIILNLAQYYLHFIDELIYFPTGIFQLTPDPMQKIETQEDLNCIIVNLLKQFSKKYYIVSSTSIEDRTKEIINYIESRSKR